MANSLDRALPVVRDLAKCKANAFVRRYGVAVSEREDVASQLMLAFVGRWSKYDGARAGVRTFASRLMDNELVSILRYGLAGRRRHLVYAPLTGDDLDCNVRGPNSFRASHTRIEQGYIRLDIERALTPLPEFLRETAHALCLYTPTEASVVLGRSRPAIYQRMHRLREAFLAAGIGPDYLTKSGQVQSSRCRLPTPAASEGRS